MQWPSLLLVCLLAAQSVQAIRFSAVPKKVPNKQWLQFSLSFEGTACADIQPKASSLLRKGARDSVKAYLQSKGESTTIVDSTAGVLDLACVDSTVGTTTYASVRSAVSFKGLTTTADRDFLFKAFKKGPCTAGYDTTVYAILADAISAAGWTVANNKASRINPWGPKGWIDLVTPDNCASSGPAPSGSPSPAPGTPSPAPSNTTSPSPTPSNSTSPAPGNTTSPAPGNTTSPSPTPGNTTSPSPTPGNSTSSSPSPVPASPSPVPDSPSPVPNSPSPAPDSPSPVPESPSPVPDSPSPAPESPSPSPVP